MSDQTPATVAPGTIHGYADRFSVAPGEQIEFKFSCDEPGNFHAEIVRLINGDTNPDGPGFLEERIETSITGDYPGRQQNTEIGSWIEIAGNVEIGDEGALHAFVMPTSPSVATQTIIAAFDDSKRAGWWLGITDGALTMRFGDGSTVSSVTTGEPLLPGIWYSVSASWSEGRTTVNSIPVINSYNSLWSPAVGQVRRGEGSDSTVKPADGPSILIAANSRGDGRENKFNGKIEAPKYYTRPLDEDDREKLAASEVLESGLAAHWNFAVEITAHDVATDHITDVGPTAFAGVCRNAPCRGMTGHNWNGREEVYRHAPDQYGAIHFHDDDLDDARWQTNVTLTVPEAMTSDVYALKATLGDFTDYVPFWVLPPRGTATSKILLLFPTASYMAYANDHIVPEVSVAQSISGHVSVIAGADLYLQGHPELGLSTYDLHNDGSGVAFSSRLRPITTMRPGFRHSTGSLWQFPADLHLVEWLNAEGLEFDVATDEDLQSEGTELLQRYNVVMTGSHPEYYSERMLDSWQDYLDRGGRAMYLGGNGFYWIIGYHPEKPHLIEVRKCEAGCRAWQARPGEYYLATTGERSGIWRNRNRAPQKLFGVGFASEGFDYSSPYRPLQDWTDDRASFITAGIENEELIGDFGLVGGGASGYEIDRYDLSLGSPPHALVVASSDGAHSDNYPRVVEEVMFPFDGQGGTDDFQVRADIVYFTTNNGGAVFTTGSISWAGSLSHNAHDNNVARMTGNVLREFAKDGPITPI